MEVREILSHFNIEGDIVDIKPLGNGHINDTCLVTTTKQKYTFQRINTSIFTNPKEARTKEFLSRFFAS